MAFRILMIGWEYPPKNSGGLGVACQGIVEHLVDAGQEVLLVLPSEIVEKKITIMVTKKGKYYPVFFLPSRIRAYPESSRDKYSGNLIEDVHLFAKDALSVLSDEKFDIVHVHDWLTVPAGIALKSKFHKPLIMHVHSTEYDRTGGGEPNWEVSQVEQAGFREADLLIAVSGYTKQLLVDRYNVSAKKIEVVYNGVEPLVRTEETDAGLLGSSPVVLFVGRLTIQKGADSFIRLAKKVLEFKPETLFVIAGDGDMYKYLVEYSAFAELTGSVLFSGFLRGMTMEKMYQLADVLVMPSVSEPFGLVALEAATLGVPVIISKTSGVAEVLPSAIKVDFWDSDLAAKYVLDILSDDDKKRELGSRLQKESASLNWDTVAVDLKNIYRRFVK